MSKSGTGRAGSHTELRPGRRYAVVLLDTADPTTCLGFAAHADLDERAQLIAATKCVGVEVVKRVQRNPRGVERFVAALALDPVVDFARPHPRLRRPQRRAGNP
jgi:hypothetical protein